MRFTVTNISDNLIKKIKFTGFKTDCPRDGLDLVQKDFPLHDDNKHVCKEVKELAETTKPICPGDNFQFVLELYGDNENNIKYLGDNQAYIHIIFEAITWMTYPFHIETRWSNKTIIDYRYQYWPRNCRNDNVRPY